MNESKIVWRTEEPQYKETYMITVQSGKYSRYVLPECKYSSKSKRWYHKIIEQHTRPVDDPEVYEETIDEEWEKVDLPVLAWAEYPCAYGTDDDSEPDAIPIEFLESMIDCADLVSSIVLGQAIEIWRQKCLSASTADTRQ